MTESALSIYEQNIYNAYLKTTRRNKGFTPRRNFNELDSEKYVLIKKVSKTIRSKKIDVDLFFKAPYELYSEKYVPLKFYSTFNAVSTYRKYVEELELTNADHPFNVTRLRESMKYIYQQCADNNIKSCKEYLDLQKGIYPNYIIDLKQGNISLYSLIALDLCENKIQLEKNIVEFAYKSFYNMLSSLRTRFTFSTKIKPLSIKLIKTIDKILKI
jgi:hypothetical protein